MTLIVQKFGGTSVADMTCIRNASCHVLREYQAGYQIVVVVSAMAGTTNTLSNWIQEACPAPDAQENDTVITTGEQITAGLMALVLQQQGLRARSWMGWQIPIRTTSHYGNADITDIETKALKESLTQGEICVVAGFQGLSPSGRLTSLGRGGSDLTAVALASSLNAERCDIYTDVEGVYTVDPRFVKTAQKIEHLSYEDMLVFSINGAKVLHDKAVRWSREHRVPLRVLSTISPVPGTWVTHQGAPSKEGVRGLTQQKGFIFFTLSCQDTETALDLLDDLREQSDDLSMISHLYVTEGYSLSFAVHTSHLGKIERILSAWTVNRGITSTKRDALSRISLMVGYGSSNCLRDVIMNSFRLLNQSTISVYGIEVASMKVTFLIPSRCVSRALEELHQSHGLAA